MNAGGTTGVTQRQGGSRGARQRNIHNESSLRVSEQKDSGKSTEGYTGWERSILNSRRCLEKMATRGARQEGRLTGDECKEIIENNTAGRRTTFRAPGATGGVRQV